MRNVTVMCVGGQVLVGRRSSSWLPLACLPAHLAMPRRSSPLPLDDVLEQLSLIMTTPDQWTCVNVGVDGIDAASKELSIVWLLVDYFSYYHISEVSGERAAFHLS